MLKNVSITSKILALVLVGIGCLGAVATAKSRRMAGNVLDASGALNQNCGALKGSVVEFLDGVRAG